MIIKIGIRTPVLTLKIIYWASIGGSTPKPKNADESIKTLVILQISLDITRVFRLWITQWQIYKKSAYRKLCLPCLMVKSGGLVFLLDSKL